ncbi:hypothetical protein ABE504_10565 [Paenibacillus oryzisoli]|uniref:hypothetical protein n=1 Tax=Paenibacillus oryzisoli TaxID=1850517 RepID=UPI003D2A7F9C
MDYGMNVRNMMLIIYSIMKIIITEISIAQLRIIVNGQNHFSTLMSKLARFHYIEGGMTQSERLPGHTHVDRCQAESYNLPYMKALMKL